MRGTRLVNDCLAPECSLRIFLLVYTLSMAKVMLAGFQCERCEHRSALSVKAHTGIRRERKPAPKRKAKRKGSYGMLESRLFLVLENSESGELEVAEEPPKINRLRPDGTSREVVETSLDKSSTPSRLLAKLWVANSICLDQILELLKCAPRLHNVDIPETKQYVEAFARYSSFSSESKN